MVRLVERRLTAVPEVQDSTTKSKQANTGVVYHIRAVVDQLWFGLEAVRWTAARERHHVAKNPSQQRPRVAVIDEIHMPAEPDQLVNSQKQRQQMCPDVHSLIVQLKHAAKVIRPRLADRPEPVFHVWLTEYRRNVIFADSR